MEESVIQLLRKLDLFCGDISPLHSGILARAEAQLAYIHMFGEGFLGNAVAEEPAAY